MNEMTRAAIARLMNNSDFREHFLGLARSRRDGCRDTALEHADRVMIYRAQGGHKALDQLIKEAETITDPPPPQNKRRIV